MKPPCPPAIDNEIASVWLKLPPPNRKRLLWVLSQMLQNQMVSTDQGEESKDEPLS